MRYRSTKTYTHNAGLSCAFRQWRATSHCKFLHGYALKVRIEFEASYLDHTNWVVDFGNLKEVKSILERIFDHKTVVAEDDPHLKWYEEGEKLGTLELVVLPMVGCEAFSRLIALNVQAYLANKAYTPRVRLVSVEVSEHEGNSAIFYPD